MKKDSKERLIEIMERVVPNFKLNEEIGGAAVNPGIQQPVAPQPAAVQQPRQPADVAALGRANKNAQGVTRTSKAINTEYEFPEAFRIWFQGLGYKPENPAISIMKVKTEVERVMKDMGYR